MIIEHTPVPPNASREIGLEPEQSNLLPLMNQLEKSSPELAAVLKEIRSAESDRSPEWRARVNTTLLSTLAARILETVENRAA